jgi:hypothetical protein
VVGRRVIGFDDEARQERLRHAVDPHDGRGRIGAGPPIEVGARPTRTIPAIDVDADDVTEGQDVNGRLHRSTSAMASG